MMGRRVKITGIGLVTPAGVGKDAFLKGIMEPVSRVAGINRFDVEAGEFVGAEVRKFRLTDFFPDWKGKTVPRHTQFALAAAQMAIHDAGLDFESMARLSPTVMVGASLMDSEVVNKTIQNVERKGPRFGLARVVFHAPVSAISTEIARLIGRNVRTLALQSACCSGSDAIGHAAQLVASGEVDVAICGGTEAPLSYHPMLELKQAGLSPSSHDRAEGLCRPFDLWRTTGVIGEGAGIVVLEPESSPRPGYSWVRSYSYATDCNGHVADGLGVAMRLALSNARLRPGDITAYNCWGPGHRVVDMAEASALHSIFGRASEDVAAFSIKGAIGNPLGAAGAIQTACSALCMQEGVIPPTVNWTHPDPACRLNLSNRTRFVDHSMTIVNSHGLSGTNSCLILERC